MNGVPNKRAERAVAVVTGGSAGLGQHIARALFRAGYDVAILGRDIERLQNASAQIAEQCKAEQSPSDPSAGFGRVVPVQADVSDPQEAQRALEHVVESLGRIDVLVNNVGMSDRGSVENLTADRLHELILANVTTALLCCRAALPALRASRGVVVNVGSMAAKVGARYLGGYPAAKHALAGLTQQMRLEWKPYGVHVALLNPGPIRRDDAGSRYATQVATDSSLPEQARQPGGGTTVKGLPPERVAAEVVRIVRRRRADVMLPGYLRPLVAVGHLWPRLGDWLLLRFTSAKSS